MKNNCQTIDDYISLGGKIKTIPYAGSNNYRASDLAIIRFHSAKHKAFKKCLNFDLTVRWIEKKIINGYCEATGISFNNEINSPFIASIDRKDSTKGYTKDNCWIVCWFFNCMKMDYDIDKLFEFCEIIIENRENILERM